MRPHSGPMNDHVGLLLVLARSCYQALHVDPPLSRRSCVKEKLFSRTAFEPTGADLNLTEEQDEDVVMVESDDEPLKKSKARVADLDDEPISNLSKGKERQGQRKFKSPSPRRRCRRHRIRFRK